MEGKGRPQSREPLWERSWRGPHASTPHPGQWDTKGKGVFSACLQRWSWADSGRTFLINSEKRAPFVLLSTEEALHPKLSKSLPTGHLCPEGAQPTGWSGATQPSPWLSGQASPKASCEAPNELVLVFWTHNLTLRPVQALRYASFLHLGQRS